MFELSEPGLFRSLRGGGLRAAPASYLALGMTVFFAMLVAAMQACAFGAPIVQTDQGAVQGFQTKGIAEFLGVPYAAAPVGDLRWMPPVKHAPWRNVLQATAYAPQCAEVTVSPFDGPANSNEDCLYLNIFTPVPGTDGRQADEERPTYGERREKLPVMFFSYGGGDADGESNDYDGSKLALQGRTVVVTFNYRLNLFGFLAHPALDNEGHLFGNYGILDNQFALKWVKQNIANFGGDPDNITVFGQSAGAWNAAAQMLSPLSKGLFDKVISESGPFPPLTPLSIAETKGVNFAVAAGCGSGTGPAVAACLRALPAATVESFAGTTQGGSAYDAGMIGDGKILPPVAITAFENGDFNHVPIIVGSAENEGNFFIAPTEYFESPRAPLTEAQYQAYVTSTFSGNAAPGGAPPAYPPGTVAAVLAQYPLGTAYPTPQLQWAATETDGIINASTCKARRLEHILASQTPLYAYEFRDQTAPFYFPQMPGFTPLAYHTGDLQYYWPLYHGGPLGTPHPLNDKQQRLSDQLVTLWTNFAWTGNPNGFGDNPWPRYTPSDPVLLSENLEPKGLTTMTDAEFSAEHRCAFWDSIIVYAPSP